MQFRELQKVVIGFCSFASLENRANKFIALINGIKEGGKVDFGCEAWFENHRLHISSGERNEFVIAYSELYYAEIWMVYSPENGFEEPVVRFKDVCKLIDWLNEKGE